MEKKPGFKKFYKDKGDSAEVESNEEVIKKPKRKRQRMTTNTLSNVQQRTSEEEIRLNKFIAHSGICSRREADKHIAAGLVRVNEEVITELGYKVKSTDKVHFEEQILRREKLVYVLLNKPKGFITSVDDPFDRRTVMDLIANAVKERIYPVGRLDRNTTGLLLFTNDGQIAKKMTHPSHEIKKIYQVSLDQNLSKAHFDAIAEGLELDDGFIKPDALAYVKEDLTKKEIGIEIHSGKNRIVRRIFEKFDYKVIKLDRVKLGGLTKKDLPRGKWRFLSPAEINMLKILA
ncbi:MAG: pseudouridine synthase [Bacteroidetes bacterium 4572_77]|nr:MAG: pseudouridine synthase [Bacteroidetes bacterium 4572_77]